MQTNEALRQLRVPKAKVKPPLDPDFAPIALATRAYSAHPYCSKPVLISIEQSDGTCETFVVPIIGKQGPRMRDLNLWYIRHVVRFLLWAMGGYRVHFLGPKSVFDGLSDYFENTSLGRFDAETMGPTIYGKPFELAYHPHSNYFPTSSYSYEGIGGHTTGCRIGFDLGGSDRKVAAVEDGKVLFAKEYTWSDDPARQTDPKWFEEELLSMLSKARKYLPQVDAVGGSAAGVYVNGQPRIASLFRGVPKDRFNPEVTELFERVRRDFERELGYLIGWEVINDGIVTASAFRKPFTLGIAMGTSTAAGYVDEDGKMRHQWLDELAFPAIAVGEDAPVNPDDPWFGEPGQACFYLSQRVLPLLLPQTKIVLPKDMGLAQKLEEVQRLFAAGDPDARAIFESIGVYLGYALLHFANFYPFMHVHALGRVTTGGGNVIVQKAREVIEVELPSLASQVTISVPGEHDRRLGQAVAAAYLPALLPDAKGA